METKCYCGHTTRCDCEPETLEEDLKFPIIIENKMDYLNLTTKIFNNGAKWQQERSYSEEEFKIMVYNMVEALAHANNMTFNGAILNELFNKFKNK